MYPIPDEPYYVATALELHAAMMDLNTTQLGVLNDNTIRSTTRWDGIPIVDRLSQSLNCMTGEYLATKFGLTGRQALHSVTGSSHHDNVWIRG